ncbi:MAG: hypothetical protein IT257_02300 [Chitinophagaceae bacterium]|nr:hypothetical protein [Chitinophagaceae bacterium]
MKACDKIRVINAGLFFSFFLLYLEWGKTQAHFMFELAMLIFTKKANSLETLTHPIIVMLIGALSLTLISACSRKPNRVLNLIAVLLMSAFVLFVLLIGFIAHNYKIALSTIPYLSCSVLFFLFRKIQSQKTEKSKPPK